MYIIALSSGTKYFKLFVYSCSNNILCSNVSCDIIKCASRISHTVFYLVLNNIIR